MTCKGCVLPSSSVEQEDHHHSSPATTVGIMVSDKPAAQPVTPDDCSPILVWVAGSSDPDVYLAKRKCPKSSSAGMLPPPPPAPAAPVHHPPPPPAPAAPVHQLAVQKVRRPRQHRVLGKRCRHCTSSETPQWRAGPEGPSTLCNACGIRYREGRLLPEYRPMASPGFEPSKHANQHRKVLQLHRRARQQQQQQVMMRGENRRGGAPPPEQQVAEEELPLPPGVIGNDDVQEWSGGDHLMHELPLPWRWNSQNKGLVGTGESSAQGYWCPLCEAVVV